MGKWCLHDSSFIFYWIIIKVAGNQDRHESLVEFDFGPNQTIFILTVPKSVLLLWFLTVTCSCCPCLYFGSAIMLVTYFVNFRQLNDYLFGKELFIRFTVSAFRELPSIYVFSYFPFGFEGRMWDLIVSVPDHCLSFYFTFELLALEWWKFHTFELEYLCQSWSNFMCSITEVWGRLHKVLGQIGSKLWFPWHRKAPTDL